jgi:N-acetylmuramoyl-L-alanine amidase
MARTGRLTAFAFFALMGTPVYGGPAGEASAPVAVGVHFSQDANAAKLVFDLSRAVDAKPAALASPDRIVIDTPEVTFQVDPSIGRVGTGPEGSLVKGFRFGPLGVGKSRIVFDLARVACPSEISSKPIVESKSAARLTIELKPCAAAAFAALVSSSSVSRGNAVQTTNPAQPVIVLDPGHGGVDSGARSLHGIQEKNVVFEFCAELKRQLDETKRYAILVTRDGDQYVDLDDRVAIARKANASLFISIHADTLNEDANVSGSTVYTVADRASDGEAARIAARENAADGGSNVGSRENNPDVTGILFDLKRRETRTYDHIFARGLVESLRGATKLNHNPERSAGFVVLKAPEFPSVLVELGYLSNAQDVQSLSSAEWRAKAAAAMVKAIAAFFAGSGTPDSASAGDSGVVSTAGEVAAPAAH